MELGRFDLRRTIRTTIEAVGGRHDEADLYAGPAGDPGLAGGPGSLSWELHGDLASVAAAGPAAILMEVLHPSVMAGVSQQSSFRTQPEQRARNTLGYVLRTTFASTEAATSVIERVARIHGRVEGTRPDGVAYRALDPELIAWVHTCIPWAIMEAYSRLRRPLSDAEKSRYLAEQAPIGLMGGADQVPTDVDELADFVEDLRPKLAVNEQTLEFLAFLTGDSDGPFGVGTLQQTDRRVDLAASMSLMPHWAQRLTGTHVPQAVRRAVLEPRQRLQAAVVRWAVPQPACKEMATARVASGAVAAAA